MKEENAEIKAAESPKKDIPNKIVIKGASDTKKSKNKEPEIDGNMNL